MLYSVGFLKGVDLRRYLERILRADVKNFTNTDEFLQRNVYFFAPVFNSYYSIRTKDGRLVHTIPVDKLIKRTDELHQLGPQDWNSIVIRKTIEKIVAAATKSDATLDAQLGKKRQRVWNQAIHHYLRWALAEGKEGPSIVDIMEILGREESLARLTQAAPLAVNSQEGP